MEKKQKIYFKKWKELYLIEFSRLILLFDFQI